MASAIAYYRKLVNNEELGKSIEFVYMRETARRTHEKRGVTKKKALSDTILQQLADKFSDCDNPGCEQDFCMIIVGIEAYGRFSDITSYIEYENLTFEKECLVVQFFKRKQDQTGKKWGPITLECDDDDDYCAYKVLMRFVTKYGISSGPLFRKLRGDGKGFVFNDCMGYNRFLERMRLRLRDIGLTEAVFLFPHLGAVFLACVGTHLGCLALCSKCVPLVPTAPWPQASTWPSLGQPNTAVLPQCFQACIVFFYFLNCPNHKTAFISVIQ